MPTYDYECSSCKYSFEKFQAITEKPKRKCPRCGRMTLRRLIGNGAAVIFRGSGFYQTDYRSKEYKEKAKAESKSSCDKPSCSSGSDTSPCRCSQGEK